MDHFLSMFKGSRLRANFIRLLSLSNIQITSCYCFFKYSFSTIHPCHTIANIPYPNLVLHLLVVHPSYQRQGLGSLLIREGLAAADRDIARTYIEASPAGLELYKRHGWVQVDEIVLDMSLYGGHGMANERVMMREPGVGI